MSPSWWLFFALAYAFSWGAKIESLTYPVICPGGHGDEVVPGDLS